ncbi:probable E3 ubiquitin-protein ligase RNF217 [Oryzias melastigma]|uniref:E3 ubiquitin-protein ligase RNF217 n=1 Tax=Oryzias melastigma TaxID=30732 RepID=A0A3B3CIC3_ORYME|nr:probable E3 ubiquitin-protein ligase RNF217 [Oryzias melastigma]
MGRASPGMEDDSPVARACTMPRFISSYDDTKGKLSRNLSRETSFADVKVKRQVRSASVRVGRSSSRLSLDEDDGNSEERSRGEEKDAEGNNNNNCNGVGRARRRASAVEIPRRNFGDFSALLGAHSRMQREQGSARTDITDENGAECEECKNSDDKTRQPGCQNEQTPSGLTSNGGESVAAECQRACESGSSAVPPGEPSQAKEHVYCTVYCIENDRHQARAEITDDATEILLETGQVGDPSPEPELYSLDDLVDPFEDISQWLYREQVEAGTLMQSCRVCLEEKSIVSLPCCGKAVCDACLKLYVSSQVRLGKHLISCPIPECSGTLEERLVLSHLTAEDVAKYQYFLELSQLDSSTKPCPQCSKFTSLKTHNPNRSESKFKIQCSNCQFVWCFKCHAPWHDGIKCRDYRKGDKLLRSWASVIEHGQRNAQKCPQCKIHIQRTEGCDHMTCAQCNTNFCYRCGERYRHLRFFGNHASNLSVFGCKYRYLPDKPHLRRLIRGSVCATKVLIAPVVILLVIVLGALALVIGLVAFPVYYVCKRKKKQRTRGSGRWI